MALFFSHPIAIPELHDSQNPLSFSWNLTSISSTLYIFCANIAFKISLLLLCSFLPWCIYRQHSHLGSVLLGWARPALLVSLFRRGSPFSQPLGNSLHASLPSLSPLPTAQGSSCTTACVARQRWQQLQHHGHLCPNLAPPSSLSDSSVFILSLHLMAMPWQLPSRSFLWAETSQLTS